MLGKELGSWEGKGLYKDMHTKHIWAGGGEHEGETSIWSSGNRTGPVPLGQWKDGLLKTPGNTQQGFCSGHKGRWRSLAERCREAFLPLTLPLESMPLQLGPVTRSQPTEARVRDKTKSLLPTGLGRQGPPASEVHSLHPHCPVSVT